MFRYLILIFIFLVVTTVLFLIKREDKDSYIFAYGSLVNDNSLSSTLFSINLPDETINGLEKIVPSSKLIKKSIQTETSLVPCRIKGLKREWNFSSKKSDNLITKPALYLSANLSDGYVCNGILIPVSKNDIKIIDEREDGYIKKEININNVTVIGNQSIDSSKKIFFYAYDDNVLVKESRSSMPPIVQSYIDLCMNGFIQIDKRLKNKDNEFTNEFIDTTYGWDKSEWINDRIYPYRPHIFTPNASIIDMILSKKISSGKITLNEKK